MRFSSGAHLDPNLPWYIARSAGFVAWGLLSTAVVWGLLFSGRMARRRPPAAWVLDLHRFLGGSAVVFTGVHLGGLAADRYTNFGLEHLLVPWTSTYRPAAVAWGVVAMWLLVAVEVTSLLMRFLPRRAWRSVHLSAFVIFVLATLHGWQAGSDSRGWVRAMFGAVATLVAVLSAVRVARRPRRSAPRGSARPIAVRTGTSSTSMEHPEAVVPRAAGAGSPDSPSTPKNPATRGRASIAKTSATPKTSAAPKSARSHTPAKPKTPATSGRAATPKIPATSKAAAPRAATPNSARPKTQAKPKTPAGPKTPARPKTQAKPKTPAIPGPAPATRNREGAPEGRSAARA